MLRAEQHFSIAGVTGYATDPATGTCYVSFDGVTATWTSAQTACSANGGYVDPEHLANTVDRRDRFGVRRNV